MALDPSPLAAYRAVLHAVRAAELAAGRNPGSVDLLAVSKTYAAGHILPVIRDGHRHFGENRVQEAQAKWPALKAEYPAIKLHLIGPLQSNKTREAVALFDVIESLDRDKIAQAVAREIQRTGRAIECLVQVNIGREPQKAGILPEDADRFIADCRDKWDIPLAGLMCIPPHDLPPAPFFTGLADIAARNGLHKLSMGMSADYKEAIKAGSTEVRIGTAIFGSRPKTA